MNFNDPNKLIFSRIDPKKKLARVNTLTEAELHMLSEDTIIKIIKQVGISRSRGRYEMHFNGKDAPCNNWNATIVAVSIWHNRLFVENYVQYSNTDTSDVVEFGSFIKDAEYRGTINRFDDYGNPRSYYYTFSSEEKDCMLRTICTTYIYLKYKDKLN